MAEMVTVGGVRYRKEDAARLKLTPDSKAFAKRIAENEVVVGTSEAQFKAAQAIAGKSGRKAAGTADAPATGVVGTSTATDPDAGGSGAPGGADAGTGK